VIGERENRERSPAENPPLQNTIVRNARALDVHRSWFGETAAADEVLSALGDERTDSGKSAEASRIAAYNSTVNTMKWAGVICALLIASWGYRTFGQRLDPPTERDTFIYGVALQFREPRLCQKVARYAEGSGGGWGIAGYQISYLQSNCYFFLADTLHDASLCDKVRPTSQGFLDGSKINPQDCRPKLHSGPTGSAVGGAVDPHVIVPMMRKLGYLDQEIRDFRYGAEVGNAVYDAYSQLRKDGLFAERIKAAPTFDEPITADKIRPANELEYVYQMFAVDINESAFCAKISPYAEAEWPQPQNLHAEAGVQPFHRPQHERHSGLREAANTEQSATRSDGQRVA
jgi:hypothetical protein